MSVYRLTPRRRAVRPHPIFLGFIAATLLGGWLSWHESSPGSRTGDIGVFVMVIGGWVVSLCLHEFAHAYAAYRAGDHSVESAGYLTLNPFRYTHPLLSIVLPLLFIVQGGIGLPGGAVYLHRHAFRSKAMQSIAAAAGPAVNVVLAVLLLRLSAAHAHSEHIRLWTGLAFLGFVQLTAAVLNLLPVPGLDGYAIVEPYLDGETVRLGEKVKPWGMLGVILLLQIVRLNGYFFQFVYWLCDRLGGNETLAAFGHQFFEFWSRSPL